MNKSADIPLRHRPVLGSTMAYRETGAESVEGFRKVLLGLLDPAERVQVDKRVRGGGR